MLFSVIKLKVYERLQCARREFAGRQAVAGVLMPDHYLEHSIGVISNMNFAYAIVQLRLYSTWYVRGCIVAMWRRGSECGNSSRQQRPRPAAAVRCIITGLAPHYALNDKLKRISIICPSVWCTFGRGPVLRRRDVDRRIFSLRCLSMFYLLK